MTTKNLTACTQLRAANMQELLTAVTEHLGEHGISLRMEGQTHILERDGGRVLAHLADDMLNIRVEAPTLDSLHDLKVMVASHFMEFSPQAIDMRWQGDGSDIQRPPTFRLLHVTASRAIAPHMLRITLAGQNLAHYASSANLHCKLYFPQAGDPNPQWPTVSPNGLPRLPQGENRPAVRTYTIRRIDHAAGSLDIDFVLHEPAGPGSRWAQNAKAGDTIGMSGPGGHGVRNADWYLLAGDETALPAIARILEELPPTARGVALVEVQTGQSCIPLNGPPGVQVQWLLRGNALPGTTHLLPEAVRAVTWPKEAGTTVFAWAGAEFAAIQTIRRHWREELGLDKTAQLAVAYWRHGSSEDGLRGS